MNAIEVPVLLVVALFLIGVDDPLERLFPDLYVDAVLGLVWLAVIVWALVSAGAKWGKRG